MNSSSSKFDLGENLEFVLDQHSERSDIEYKSWIDLNDANVKADTARHICALANFGGGFLVFGKNNDGEFSVPRPKDLSAYSHDVINSIVKKYLAPSFECEVRLVTSSSNGNRYPVVLVPSHGATPIAAKKDGPQDTKGKPQGIRQGAHYTRAPGPESVPVNTPDLWRAIIHRCVINERTNLLASISRLFDKPVEIATSKQIDSVMDLALSKWVAADFRDDQLVDPRNHYCAFAFLFQNLSNSRCLYSKPLRSLSRTIEEIALQAERESKMGWGLFGITEIDIKPTITVQDDAEAYQALMVTRHDGALNAPAIWSVSSAGYGVEVRGYHEDSWWLRDAVASRRGPNIWQPGSYFSPSIEHLRVYQFVWFVFQLSLRYEEVAKIQLSVEYAGLAGREIKDSDPWSRYDSSLKSTEGKRRFKIAISPEALASKEAKIETAARLLGPIGRLFNGWEITAEAIAHTLKADAR